MLAGLKKGDTDFRGTEGEQPLPLAHPQATKVHTIGSHETGLKHRLELEERGAGIKISKEV